MQSPLFKGAPARPKMMPPPAAPPPRHDHEASLIASMGAGGIGPNLLVGMDMLTTTVRTGQQELTSKSGPPPVAVPALMEPPGLEASRGHSGFIPPHLDDHPSRRTATGETEFVDTPPARRQRTDSTEFVTSPTFLRPGSGEVPPSVLQVGLMNLLMAKYGEEPPQSSSQPSASSAQDVPIHYAPDDVPHIIVYPPAEPEEARLAPMPVLIIPDNQFDDDRSWSIMFPYYPQFGSLHIGDLIDIYIGDDTLNHLTCGHLPYVQQIVRSTKKSLTSKKN